MKHRRCPMCECTTKGAAVRFTRNATVCTLCVASLAARNRKWCNRCKAEYLPADYSSTQSACRACVNAAHRASNARHAAQRREAARAYYAAHQAEIAAYRDRTREQRRAYDRAYQQRRREVDPDGVRAYARLVRQRNPAAARARYHRWRTANLDRARLHNKRSRMRRILAELRRAS